MATSSSNKQQLPCIVVVVALVVFSVLLTPGNATEATTTTAAAKKIVGEWKWLGECTTLEKCKTDCVAGGHGGSSSTDLYDFVCLPDIDLPVTVCGCPITYVEDDWGTPVETPPTPSAPTPVDYPPVEFPEGDYNF